MNKKIYNIAIAVVLTFAIEVIGATRQPTAEELSKLVRHDHPRLFVNKEIVAIMRASAASTAKDDLKQLLNEVDSMPKNPKLEFKPDVCDFNGKKIIFKRNINDQNACVYAVKNNGGISAYKCALAWLLTGDMKYRNKALAYIKINAELIDYCHESKILYDWYCFSRMGAITAYDWIYDTLSPNERKNIMSRYLKHVDFMRKPGFIHNDGGAQSGNYGDLALMWYVGLAALGDGIDDPLAKDLLQNGYKLFSDMMDYRDMVSGNSGILSSICSGYSFGAYPMGSFLFLHSLRSSTGIDGTEYWTQLSHYANWFVWASIPAKDMIYDYGLGDAGHFDNKMSVENMYTYLTQIIYLYEKKYPQLADFARAAIELLPVSERKIRCWNCPFLPFIFQFDPQQPPKRTLTEYLEGKTSEFFDNFGLLIMRSGSTEQDTFAAFKAGAKFSTHQHYDENSFVVYRGGYQALDSGTRGNAPHHKVYYPQTIAHNAMLIRAENEPLPPYWYPANAPAITGKIFNDGGQNRLKGCSVSVDSSPYHAVGVGDATECYSPDKCQEAIRFFVFVKPDIFIVYDRITSKNDDQNKYFVLHTQNQLLKKSDTWYSRNGDGALFIKSLLPKQSKVNVIGGENHEFVANGKNFMISIEQQPWLKKKNWLGQYRLEITAPRARKKERFLTVLQSADTQKEAMTTCKLFQDETYDSVEFLCNDGAVGTVRFCRDGEPGGQIQLLKEGKVLLKRELIKTSPKEYNLTEIMKKIKFAPLTIPGLEPRPNWWRVRVGEIIEQCRSIKKGKVKIIANTPAGFPVYAIFYGDFQDVLPQTNWSAGASSGSLSSYFKRKELPQTVLFCAGFHGAEAESVAAAVNLLQMLETGKDFRGKSDKKLLTLLKHYRLIVVPCVNMDGRAISPDHLRKASDHDFRYASQGAWLDGSLVGWQGSKEYFPLPLEKVSFPGGYPNSEGYNIMHDASPGNIKTVEARAILQLCERYSVDLLLNGHSCEFEPFMIPASAIGYPALVKRGELISEKVNQALTNENLRKATTQPVKAGNVLNFNTVASLTSGALALTLECSVSLNFSFEELMKPNFVMLKTILEDGFDKPFVDRAELVK